MTRFALPALAVTLLLLLALPPFVGLSIQNALTKMLIASLFAAAFNLLAGQAGLDAEVEDHVGHDPLHP